MRYAIITDVHANIAALEAVDNDVRQIRTKQNEEIEYWFLGDLVGYGPDPVACIKWLKNPANNIGNRWIAGNHDEWLTLNTKVSEEAWSSLNKHQKLLQEPMNRSVGGWFVEEVRRAIENESRSLVRESWTESGMEAWFTHAAVQKTQRRMTYLCPWKRHTISDTFDLLWQEYHQQPTTILFCGHTHFPMWFHDKQLKPLAYARPLPLDRGIHIVNPGSVGQPRDGDARAAYLLFDPIAKTVEFRRVKYDVGAVADRLQREGFMPSLAERLVTADGRGELQEFLTMYRRPIWDLEVVSATGS